MRHHKLLYCLLVGVILTGMLSACSGNSSVIQPSVEQVPVQQTDTEAVKIMYMNRQNFMNDYGNLLREKIPDVNFEVVSTQDLMFAQGDERELLVEFIENEQPDILSLYPHQYQWLIEEQQLVDLEPFILNDRYDISNVHQPVMDLLKEYGEGRLFGLSPLFTAEVLYYNKDLFEQNGVPLPVDRMSWEELLELAQRFPSNGDPDERIYGYSQDVSNIANLTLTIGASAGLRAVDEGSNQVTFQSEEWKHVLTNIVQALKADAISTGQLDQPMSQRYEDSLRNNLFVSGRSAMAIGTTFAMDQLLDAKEKLPGYEPFNWGIVTSPVDPGQSDVGNVILGSIFAIREGSGNKEAAWDLLKVINGEETARTWSQSSRGNLPARYVQSGGERNGVGLSPFYALKPRMSAYSSTFSADFYQSLHKIIVDEIILVVDDRQSVEAALAEIERKGQIELDRFLIECNISK